MFLGLYAMFSRSPNEAVCNVFGIVWGLPRFVKDVERPLINVGVSHKKHRET